MFGVVSVRPAGPVVVVFGIGVDCFGVFVKASAMIFIVPEVHHSRRYRQIIAFFFIPHHIVHRVQYAWFPIRFQLI